MPVRGTLKADTLVVAQIEVDMLQNPIRVHALAALVSSESGQTVAWANGDGGMWSSETLRKLQELREAMEQDLARRLFHEGRDVPETEAGVRLSVGGLSEHLGEGAEAPSI